MNRSNFRKPTVLDVMILIAATAVGLELAQVAWPRFTSDWVGLGWFSVTIVYEMLMPWTVGLLLIGLRRPRPRLRRLARQPGFVACAVAVPALGVALASAIPLFHIWRAFEVSLLQIFVWVVAAPGMPVAAAWLTLALGGRWRPEPSWMDRLGRVIGVLWILAILVKFVLAVASMPR